MSTVITMTSIPAIAPRLKARIAGFFYLLTIVTGSAALFSDGSFRSAAELTAAISYLIVTFFLYDIFKPVSRGLSLVAALFSVAGFLTGRLQFEPSGVALSLALFGVYCVMIGYLIMRSTFMPHIIGALMMFGGLAWLTFASPALANSLRPFNMLAGAVAEGVLTVWLMAVGLDTAKWEKKARRI